MKSTYGKVAIVAVLLLAIVGVVQLKQRQGAEAQQGVTATQKAEASCSSASGASSEILIPAHPAPTRAVASAAVSNVPLLVMAVRMPAWVAWAIKSGNPGAE